MPINRRATNYAMTVVSWSKASFAELGENEMLREDTSIMETPNAFFLSLAVCMIKTLKYIHLGSPL